MKELKDMTEQELRDYKVEWPKTIKELLVIINTLTKRKHDYGTCVYAMSIAATATFNYVAHVLGVTGFQASCADMDIIRRTRGYKIFSIIDYENILYPQYADRFEKTISKETWEELQKQAKELLLEKDRGIPVVRSHWESIVAGNVPFGFRLK